MATVYPAAFDTLATVFDGTTSSGPQDATSYHANLHKDERDAIKAVQTEMGLNPSGSFADITARFAGGIQTCRKTADQSTTSTTLTNVTDLLFPVTIGADHTFEWIVTYTSAATATGLAIGLTVPALGAGGYLSATGLIPRGTATAAGAAPAIGGVEYPGYITASGGAIVADSTPAANTVYTARLRGVLSNPSAAGSIQLQVRTEVNGSAIVIKKGASGRMLIN